MITLTTEQAQQIEKSLSGWKEYDAWTDQQMWNNDDEKALVTIREARAQEQAEQEPVAEIIGFERTKDIRGVKRIPSIKWNVPLWEDESPLQLGNLYAAPVRTKNLTDAVDAAMVEMQNIHPPLRRSECERLIRAANYAAPVPTKDLTDAEIGQSWVVGMTLNEFARSVIAKDREKNRG